MPGKWSRRRVRMITGVVCAGVIVGFTVANVTVNARTTAFACLVGLFPVAFFSVGGQHARGLASAIAVVIVGAYSAGWVYAVGQYNPDKVDGVGLGLVSLAALGVAALTPALAAHWLAYIWRDWRAGADVAGPS